MESENSSASSGNSSVIIKRTTKRNPDTSVKARDSSEARASREQLLCESTSMDDLPGMTVSNEIARVKQTGKRRKRKNYHQAVQPSSTAIYKTISGFILLISLVMAGSTVWLFFDIRGQATSLRYQIEKVSAGTQDLPQQIQNCRSVNRQLKLDLADLSGQMSFITQKFDNFSSQIDHNQNALLDVQSKLHSYPELIDVPKQLDVLSQNVANFGSQLQDIQLKTSQLSSMTSDMVLVKTNLSVMHDALNSLNDEALLEKNKTKDREEKQVLGLIEKQLNDKLNALNQSLMTRLNWTSVDQKNDHRTIDDLQEKFANMSSQLLTFNENLTSLTSNMSSLSNQVTSLKSITAQTTSPAVTQRPITTVQNKKTPVVPDD